MIYGFDPINTKTILLPDVGQPWTFILRRPTGTIALAPDLVIELCYRFPNSSWIAHRRETASKFQAHYKPSQKQENNQNSKLYVAGVIFGIVCHSISWAELFCFASPFSYHHHQGFDFLSSSSRVVWKQTPIFSIIFYLQPHPPFMIFILQLIFNIICCSQNNFRPLFLRRKEMSTLMRIYRSFWRIHCSSRERDC